MKYGWFHILILCLLTNVGELPAQAAEAAATESELLTKNFQFEDGIYGSFEAFQSNQPTYAWDEVEAAVFSNPQNFMAQVQYIEHGKGDSTRILDLEEIWGISLGGIPYIRLPKGTVNKSLTVFAGMRLRGKICYFNYENEIIRKVEMPVYNPVNKSIFRKAWIDRKESVQYEKMLHFETGEIQDFTIPNFKTWIADDSRLVKTVAGMEPRELEEKLFKCLLIYVDRNQVEIRKETW